VTVQRFRTIADMNAAPIIVPPGKGFERFARHCRRYWSISPRVYPRGVFRFRTLAEAQAAREQVGREAIPGPPASSRG
jgi:hypothetical protein